MSRTRKSEYLRVIMLAPQSKVKKPRGLNMDACPIELNRDETPIQPQKLAGNRCCQLESLAALVKTRWIGRWRATSRVQSFLRAVSIFL